jgi:hypothetical protein
MANFPEIHKELTSINTKLEVYAKGIKFTNRVEFKLSDYKTDLLEIPKSVMGIYFFEIKKNDSSLAFNDWITKFKEKWEKNDITNRPKPRKKSIEKLSGYTEDWIPFYIGKSEKIQYRVNQHIAVGKTTTSALKLILMGNLENETFRLSFVEINVGNKLYNLVMPKIEEVLRNELYPIIGKQ